MKNKRQNITQLYDFTVIDIIPFNFTLRIAFMFSYACTVAKRKKKSVIQRVLYLRDGYISAFRMNRNVVADNNSTQI